MIYSDINPFQVLYVTDSPDPSAFVKLFSDFPVKNTLQIFQKGNVILKGTQGSGKSMLLNLLRPQIRLAYHEAKCPFPVPPAHRRFISAGINLTLSGALDIGQRPVQESDIVDESLFPLLFADFVNYFVVRDLLSSLKSAADNPKVFEDIVDPSKLDEFACDLAQNDCWFGYLKNVDCFNTLSQVVNSRLSDYRSFHQFNSDLPVEILSTKTRIGAPIAAAHDSLKNTTALEKEVPLFVRIDQLERLYRSDIIRPKLGHEYRRIINKALGQRDSRVSYRVGTRRYAWEDDLKIYATDDKLEEKRDFTVIDLEDALRRKENRKSWIFPAFAEDAFRKRLENANFGRMETTDIIGSVFGEVKAPEEAAKHYAGNAKPEAILRLDNNWHEEWRAMLSELFKSNPLEAVLASAWARQRGRGKQTLKRFENPPPDNKPWTKITWRKERVRQCLVQIAARNSQKLQWSGKDHILAISSPNISVFLSVCHEIWDTFIRTEQSKPESQRANPLLDGIHSELQAIAIQTASNDWYRKIAEQPHGHDRQRFIEVLGRKIRTWLLDDVAMSYPGHVGFSLIVDELSTFPELNKFLDDASDYGDLYEAEHTTKEKNRRRRKKWYLSPIFSPYFQIPEAHPKEPRYSSPEEVIEWTQEAGILQESFPEKIIEKKSSSNKQPIESDRQLRMFDFGPDEESV